MTNNYARGKRLQLLQYYVTTVYVLIIFKRDVKNYETINICSLYEFV
jgi:hypothetical protein